MSKLGDLMASVRRVWVACTPMHLDSMIKWPLKSKHAARLQANSV